MLGSENFGSFGCGWWTITFPDHDRTNECWAVDGNWHIDGHYFQHYTFSHQIGLIPIMFFSDVYTNGGGTSVLEGSHNVAIKLLAEAGLNGLSSKSLAQSVLSSRKVSNMNIVELTGKAGDVVFIHPLLLHTRSTNLSTSNNPNGIRFICHPSIPLKQHMRFNKPFQNLTILEKTMVLGVMTIDLTTSQFEDVVYKYHNPLLTENQDFAKDQVEIEQHQRITNSKHNVTPLNRDSAKIDDDASRGIHGYRTAIQMPYSMYNIIEEAMLLLNSITPEICSQFASRSEIHLSSNSALKSILYESNANSDLTKLRHVANKRVRFADEVATSHGYDIEATVCSLYSNELPTSANLHELLGFSTFKSARK